MTPLQASAPRRSVSVQDRCPVRPMSLSFRNCLGIAAGIDRDGSILPALPGLTVGHVEVGTVTNPRDLKLLRIHPGSALIIGVNVGSAKAGFSNEVLFDYRDCLLSALSRADYVALNFSNETAQRTLKSEAGHRIVSMARSEISRRPVQTDRRTPLLAKFQAGAPGDVLPLTQSISEELDGFVIVGDRIERISEIRAAFPDHGIVSVGGVRSAEEVLRRQRAGSDLVQVHRAYAEGGVAAIERILSDLEGASDV